MAESVSKCFLRDLMRGNEVTAHFNPTTFKVAKTIPWAKHPGKGGESPTMEFTHGEPKNISFDLLLDSYEQDGASVQGDIEALEQMTKPVEAEGHPPKVLFQWGEFQFHGVIESLSTVYQMFRANGAACRATVSITMKEVETGVSLSAQETEEPSPQEQTRQEGPQEGDDTEAYSQTILGYGEA